MNGLPLVQIELKRRGLELKEAFNQVNRYQRHSYWAEDGLFQYVQMFVISNGVNTKYYANNRKQSLKQTFYWADTHNERFTELSQFATQFLTPQHLTDMITKYVVLNETDRVLMVMRSYQIYATEAIIARVAKRSALNAINQPIDKLNGYIWHTTGSGKTLTSFKTAQLLTGDSQIHRVVFVVDRKDLDYQTSKEFNGFAKGCVDSTDNTRLLVDQFTDAPIPADKINERRNTKLIVTTIQKLNNAISHKRFAKRMEPAKDKNVIFIFDECHRSLFGDTHQKISSFFTSHQMFGFTGTPIFVENAVSKYSRKYTTKDSESYYNYYNDISKKVRERKIDILLVVNMFLTGFDSKTLNTLYVDKNLKYHGLIQAYSRTNRILNEQKSQCNIMCFRNLKNRTDEALALFSNKDAKDTVIMPPYEDFIALFNKALEALKDIALDTNSVNDLQDEHMELEFIKVFRELMRLRNVLSTFADFEFSDVDMDEQEFEDYKSKYLDLYDKVKTNTLPEKESILEEVDFELELLAMDEVNVAYILQLLSKLQQADNDEDYHYQYKSLMQIIGGDPNLRSKQELIDKFIKENLPNVKSAEEVDDAFEAYWEVEKEEATKQITDEENLVPDRLKEVVERMIYSNRDPLREDIVRTMEKPPSV